MGDSTHGIVPPADWTYLYDLVEARRIVLNKPPLRFMSAIRYTFVASAAGTIFLTNDPTDNPPGMEISADDINPTIRESSGSPHGPSIRNFFVKGNAAATLQVDCDY